MNKKKWIVGLSIVGVMALSGTAFALTSGSAVVQSVGLAPTVATTQNQGTVADTNRSTTQSSPNNTSNGVATPGSNGYRGGYGMMGGQGANGNGGGYGMMGGGYDAKSLGINLRTVKWAHLIKL